MTNKELFCCKKCTPEKLKNSCLNLIFTNERCDVCGIKIGENDKWCLVPKNLLSRYTNCYLKATIQKGMFTNERCVFIKGINTSSFVNVDLIHDGMVKCSIVNGIIYIPGEIINGPRSVPLESNITTPIIIEEE